MAEHVRGPSRRGPRGAPGWKRRDLVRRFQRAPPPVGQEWREDALGEALAEWLSDRNMATLNDGEGTWYARGDGRRAIRAPEITIETALEASRSGWTRLNRLPSEHIPILIEWKRPFRVERSKKISRNTRKVDWEVMRRPWTQS